MCSLRVEHVTPPTKGAIPLRRSLLAVLCVLVVVAGLTSRVAPQAGGFTTLKVRSQIFPGIFRAYHPRPHQDSGDVPAEAPTTTSAPPRAVVAPSGPTRRYVAPAARTGWPSGVEQWRAAVSAYNWPVDRLLAIIARESGGDPLAVNKWSGACGLTQLLPCPAGGLDALSNLRFAYFEKYLPACGRGDCLSPWGY